MKVSFPKNYASENLAGQSAEVRDHRHPVEAPQESKIDEDFAKSLGMESLDKLKEAVRERLVMEFAGASRQRVKRKLLDRLDAEPPLRSATLAGRRRIPPDVEFDRSRDELDRQDIRRRADHRRRSQGGISQDCGSPRAAWPGAVRDREENKITVTDDEVSRAVIERARSDARPRKRSGTTIAAASMRWPSFVLRSVKTRWSTSSWSSPM